MSDVPEVEGKEARSANEPVLETLAPREFQFSNGHGLAGKAQIVYNYIIVSLACFIMLTLTILMGAEVVFRYVLDSSLIWAEESGRYLMVWGTFLFAGAAFQRGEMIAVEFFIDLMNYYVGLILSLFGYALSLALLGLLVYYGYRHAAGNIIQTVPAFDFIWSSVAGRPANISIFWIYISLPVGCALLGVHIVLAMLDKLGRLFSPPPGERRVGGGAAAREGRHAGDG